MKIEGTVTKIMPPTSGEKNGKTWTSQDFVLEIEQGEYPQAIVVNVFNNKIDVDKLIVGNEYECSLNFNANEYNGKVYNKISCWKIEGEMKSGNTPAPIIETPPVTENDLPF